MPHSTNNPPNNSNDGQLEPSVRSTLQRHIDSIPTTESDQPFLPPLPLTFMLPHLNSISDTESPSAISNRPQPYLTVDLQSPLSSLSSLGLPSNSSIRNSNDNSGIANPSIISAIEPYHTESSFAIATNNSTNQNDQHFNEVPNQVHSPSNYELEPTLTIPDDQRFNDTYFANDEPVLLTEPHPVFQSNRLEPSYSPPNELSLSTMLTRLDQLQAEIINAMRTIYLNNNAAPSFIQRLEEIQNDSAQTMQFITNNSSSAQLPNSELTIPPPYSNFELPENRESFLQSFPTYEDVSEYIQIRLNVSEITLQYLRLRLRRLINESDSNNLDEEVAALAVVLGRMRNLSAIQRENIDFLLYMRNRLDNGNANTNGGGEEDSAVDTESSDSVSLDTGAVIIQPPRRQPSSLYVTLNRRSHDLRTERNNTLITSVPTDNTLMLPSRYESYHQEPNFSIGNLQRHLDNEDIQSSTSDIESTGRLASDVVSANELAPTDSPDGWNIPPPVRRNAHYDITEYLPTGYAGLNPEPGTNSNILLPVSNTRQQPNESSGAFWTRMRASINQSQNNTGSSFSTRLPSPPLLSSYPFYESQATARFQEPRSTLPRVVRYYTGIRSNDVLYGDSNNNVRQTELNSTPRAANTSDTTFSFDDALNTNDPQYMFRQNQSNSTRDPTDSTPTATNSREPVPYLHVPMSPFPDDVETTTNFGTGRNHRYQYRSNLQPRSPIASSTLQERPGVRLWRLGRRLRDINQRIMFRTALQNQTIPGSETDYLSASRQPRLANGLTSSSATIATSSTDQSQADSSVEQVAMPASPHSENNEGDILDFFSVQPGTDENRRAQLHQILQGGFSSVAYSDDSGVSSTSFQSTPQNDSNFEAFSPRNAVSDTGKDEYLSSPSCESDFEDSFFEDMHTGDDVEMFKKRFDKDYDPFKFYKADGELSNFHSTQNDTRETINHSFESFATNKTTQYNSTEPTGIQPFNRDERSWARQELDYVLKHKQIDWCTDVDDNALKTNAPGENTLVFRSLNNDEKSPNSPWLQHGVTFDIPSKSDTGNNDDEDKELNELLQTFERTQIHDCQSDAELRQQKYKYTQSGTPGKKRVEEDVPFIPYDNHSDDESNHFFQIICKQGDEYFAIIRGKLFSGKVVVPLNCRFFGLGGRIWVKWKPVESIPKSLTDQDENEDEIVYGPVGPSFTYSGPLSSQISWMRERVRIMRVLSTTFESNPTAAEIFQPYMPDLPITVTSISSYRTSREFATHAYDTMQAHIHSLLTRLKNRVLRIEQAKTMHRHPPRPSTSSHEGTHHVEHSFGSNDHNSNNSDPSYYYSNYNRGLSRSQEPIVQASSTVDSRSGYSNGEDVMANHSADNFENFIGFAANELRPQEAQRSRLIDQLETPTRRGRSRLRPEGLNTRQLFFFDEESGEIIWPSDDDSSSTSTQIQDNLFSSRNTVEPPFFRQLGGEASTSSRQAGTRFGLALEQSAEPCPDRPGTIHDEIDISETCLGYSASGSPFTGMFITGIRHRDGDMFLAESIFECCMVGTSAIKSSSDSEVNLQTKLGLTADDCVRLQMIFRGRNMVNENDLSWLIDHGLAAPVMTGVVEQLKPGETSWCGAAPVFEMM